MAKFTARYPYEWPVISESLFKEPKSSRDSGALVFYSPSRYVWNYVVCGSFVALPITFIFSIYLLDSRHQGFYHFVVYALTVLPVFILAFSPEWPASYFRYVRWVHKQQRHAKWIVAAAVAWLTEVGLCPLAMVSMSTPALSYIVPCRTMYASALRQLGRLGKPSWVRCVSMSRLPLLAL